MRIIPRLFLNRISLVAATIMSLTALAQQPDILLRNATIQAHENVSSFIEGEVPAEDLYQGAYYRIVQFDHVLLQNEVQRLHIEGIELLEYLPHFAYITAISTMSDRAILREVGARSVINMGPAIKLHPRLKDGNYPEHAVSGDHLFVVVQMQKHVNAANVYTRLQKAGLTDMQLTPAERTLQGTIRIAQLNDLADLPFVCNVEPISEEGEPESLAGRALHRSSKIATEYAGGLKYDGTGVSIVINDDGFVGPHIDFTGRVDQSDVAGDFLGDHGDMTAGIAGGAGNLDPTITGMAPGSFIWVRQYNPNLPDVVSLHTNEGVMAFSSSYSNGCNAGYTNTTQQVDDQINTYPTMIQSFSAGNSNGQDCGYGAGNQWGNITGGHKIGKNVITAANLRYNEVIETSSSRGPASDGRIKPDIAAHGTGQLSTDPNNTYNPGGGTSAACPGITGIFAQLVHAHRGLNGGGDAESGLIKACMLNTAYDLGNPGPDFIFGWGRVNAGGAYNILEKNQYVTDNIDQAGSTSHTVTVPAGVEEMRAMLYWMDPASTTIAAKALVNDLDLTVVDAAGGITQPLVLDPTPTTASLNAPAVQGVDTLNNMEQVVISNPVSGVYSFNVAGTEVPMGPQKYYIVWEFFSGIDISSPVGGEGLVPGEDVRILWEAVADTGTFQLDYSTDGGSSWLTIGTAPGTARAYENWVVPSVISGDVRVRVSRGGDSDMSDVDCTIMEVPAALDVIRVCPTEIRLIWDSVPGATSYTVHVLGAKYMDSVATAFTQLHDLQVTDIFQDFWWSVTAHGDNGARSRRAYGQYYAGGGLVNCSVDDELSAVNVLSPLGTLVSCHGIDSILQVRFSNFGLLDQSGFQIGYRVNGGTPVLETFTGVLAAGTSVDHSFTTPLPVGTNTVLNIEAWSDLAGDVLQGNDTTTSTLNILQVVSGGSLSEDFESFASCGVASDCAATTCALGNRLVNVENGVDDDIDWRVDSDGTPSQSTGPAVDHTLGNQFGQYIYTEASNGCTEEEAHLLIPCIDVSSISDPAIEVYYHMLGVDMGSLHIDVYDGTTWNLDVAPPISGPQSNAWIHWVTDLSAYSNTVIDIRYRGITGTDWQSDIALDDIGLVSITGIDDAASDNDFQLFPNPNDGSMVISFSGESPSDIQELHVFDVSGALVYTEQLRGTTGASYELDLQFLQSGFYTLTVRGAEGDRSERFVINQ